MLGKECGLPSKTAIRIMAKNKRKKRISCLGALLIFVLLAVVVCTGTIRLLFKDGAAPSFFGSRYVYYTEDDMGSRVPEGSLVFAEDTAEINTQDIVLYKNDQDQYRIGVASLIVDTDSSVPEQTGKTYYLTTVTNTTAFETDESRIVGICLRRSAELGAFIGFALSIGGMIVGLILPVVLLLIYLVFVIAKGGDADYGLAEDADNDLEFVKSIQQKQQKIAERDAERAEKERKKVQTFDDDFYDDASHREKPMHRMSDEEIARMEEEEAARRAERIAAVRSHMEQRRQTETPDGVPLYTTEIITKTHTLSIPKVGDKPLTTTQQPLKPTPTADIPRLTATGHIQIPTAEQLAEEKAREDRMRKAQELARAAQDEAFGIPSYRSAHERTEEERIPTRREEPVSAPVEKPAPAVQPAAPVTAPAPAAPVQPAASAPAAPVASAPAPEVKKVVKKTVKKPQIASSSFNDLMAFLDNEQKKL